MQKKKPNVDVKFPKNSRDLPASQGMLQLVRSELKSDIRGLRSEMKSGFDQMNSKFSQVDSKFNHMDSKFEQVLSEVSRIGTMIEEQNSRNQVVLEGLTGLYQRQDQNELRAEELRSLVQGLAIRSQR